MNIIKIIKKIINKKKNLLTSIKTVKVLLIKEGFFVTTIHLTNYFFYIFFNNKLHIDTPLEKYKKFLAAEIVRITNKKIINGIYKSVYLNFESHWNILDFASKLLGFYEQQVQEKIIALQKKYNLTNIVNIGAGEGYHIVSLIKNKFFEKGLAYEINTEGQNIIKKNLLDNNISGKVSVFGEGNFYSINKNIKKRKNFHIVPMPIRKKRRFFIITKWIFQTISNDKQRKSVVDKLSTEILKYLENQPSESLIKKNLSETTALQHRSNIHFRWY